MKLSNQQINAIISLMEKHHNEKEAENLKKETEKEQPKINALQRKYM